MRRWPGRGGAEDEDQGEGSDLEDAKGALLEGARAYTPGSARAALAHRSFRLVWIGSMASNIGTWMQNIALGVLAYQLTRSSSFVALLGFAQLGPLLVLSIVGGLLADAIDRRLLMVVMQIEQMVLSFVLAWVATSDRPPRASLLLCVLGIGIGNALYAPTASAVLPIMVGKEDLPGAVSLQSLQMNLSRVVGPAIGGLLLPAIGAGGVFAVNGFTYLFAIATLLTVDIPRPYPQFGEQGWRRLVAGFAVARADPLVGRCLFTIASFSFASLPFIGLMPVLAARNLRINIESSAYGVLYATFGLGAACGAVSVGTWLVRRSKPTIVRVGLAVFAVFLLVLSQLRVAAPAYPVIFLIGFAYFAAVTSLSTILQQHLDDHVRGRVMALWIMGFGGTVPVGLLVFGAVADRTSVTFVVVVGAAYAALLAVVTRVDPTRTATGRAPAPR